MGAMALIFKFYVSKSALNSVYAVHLASSWFISNVTILKMCPLNFIWSLLSGMALTTTLPPSWIQSYYGMSGIVSNFVLTIKGNLLIELNSSNCHITWYHMFISIAKSEISIEHCANLIPTLSRIVKASHS